MKFDLGLHVKLCHTVDDGRTGKVVGVFSSPVFGYGPERAAHMCVHWSEKLGTTREDLIQSPLYYIRLDVPAMAVDEETARRDMRDKFPDEAEFQRWYKMQTVMIVSTPEADLSGVVPDTIEGLLQS